MRGKKILEMWIKSRNFVTKCEFESLKQKIHYFCSFGDMGKHVGTIHEVFFHITNLFFLLPLPPPFSHTAEGWRKNEGAQSVGMHLSSEEEKAFF